MPHPVRPPQPRWAWRVSRTAEASFVLEALKQALHARQPTRGTGLIHHSDRGVPVG